MMNRFLGSLFQGLQEPALRNPLAISLGAIAGALLRYYIGLAFAALWGVTFPWGTFFVNITGSFMMGLFTTLVTEKVLNLSPDLVLLIAVGFLGSYTTFSSYELDTFKLFDRGASQFVIIYWLGSAILGFIALRFGILLAHQWK